MYSNMLFIIKKKTVIPEIKERSQKENLSVSFNFNNYRKSKFTLIKFMSNLEYIYYEDV